MKKYKDSKTSKGDNLPHRIEQLLEEVRIVLPGSQVLLGFQFSAIFANNFDNLSKNLQYIHLMSLGFILITIILLIVAPAYHRIVEAGRDSERFHKIVSIFLVCAMVSLIIGVSIDLWVVLQVVVNNDYVAYLGSISTLLLAFLLWFIAPLLLNKKNV